MAEDFRNQCLFLAESTGLHISHCVRLMKAAYRDRLALYSAIKDLGAFSQGRRRWLFKLVSATRNGFDIFCGKELVT